jgi:hypothetical protein
VQAWATEVDAEAHALRATGPRHVYREIPRRFVLLGDGAHPVRVASDEREGRARQHDSAMPPI